jgi:ribosomal protein S27AE
MRFEVQAGREGIKRGRRVGVSEDKILCPQCGTRMEETPHKVEPQAIPSVAKQPLDHVEAGVLVTRLECPKCHHAEGRFPKGRGTWKNTQGKSTV